MLVGGDAGVRVAAHGGEELARVAGADVEDVARQLGDGAVVPVEGAGGLEAAPGGIEPGDGEREPVGERDVVVAPEEQEVVGGEAGGGVELFAEAAEPPGQIDDQDLRVVELERLAGVVVEDDQLLGAAVVLVQEGVDRLFEQFGPGVGGAEATDGGQVGRGAVGNLALELLDVAGGVGQQRAERLAAGEADGLVGAGEAPVDLADERQQVALDHLVERLDAILEGVDRSAHPEVMPGIEGELVAGLEGENAVADPADGEAGRADLDVGRIGTAVPARLEPVGAE